MASLPYGQTALAQDQVSGGIWTATHFGHDAHGNVRYLTDVTGRATDTFDYDAFGSVIARSGTTPATRLFTGEEFDADLGLYQLRARYQNPGTGRFWTRDSFDGYPGSPASQQPWANFRSAFSAAEAQPTSGFAAIRVRAFPFFM